MVAQTVYESIINILSEIGKDVSQVRLTENIIDYTINFFNNAAIKVKTGKKNYIYVKSIFLENFPESIKLENVKATPNYLRFEYESSCDLTLLSQVIENIYQKTSLLDDPFGCCSRYLLCSDELKCVQPDKELAAGCIYKKSLDLGKVFYGKNRNM